MAPTALGNAPKRTICVIGLGYVGLPTAAMLARARHRVLGVDINRAIVDRVNRGECPVQEQGLAEIVAAEVASGRLRASTKVEPADIFQVCVSVPLRGQRVDFRALQSALRQVTPTLRRGNLVIIESTVPPGTTERLVRSTLEGSGLTVGQDFYLAYCPERVLPGNLVEELVHNDRLIGGVDAESARRAADVYQGFVKGDLIRTDALTAELAKLLENTYRAVNIALANEFALLAESAGGDARKAIEVANRHPRVHVHQPGPGLGGHCIPKDPWILLHGSKARSLLIRSAMETSAVMRRHVVALLTDALHLDRRSLGRSRVCVLGVAYKGGVSDTRDSPGWALAKELRRRGAKVVVHDPRAREPGVLENLEEAVAGCAAVVIVADHPEYRRIDWGALGKTMASRPVLVDTRGLVVKPPAHFLFRSLGRAMRDGSSGG